MFNQELLDSCTFKMDDLDGVEGKFLCKREVENGDLYTFTYFLSIDIIYYLVSCNKEKL